jgi:hypothetical protein
MAEILTRWGIPYRQRLRAGAPESAAGCANDRPALSNSQISPVPSRRCAPIVVACMNIATGLGGSSGTTGHPLTFSPLKDKGAFTPAPTGSKKSFIGHPGSKIGRKGKRARVIPRSGQGRPQGRMRRRSLDSLMRMKALVSASPSRAAKKSDAHPAANVLVDGIGDLLGHLATLVAARITHKCKAARSSREIKAAAASPPPAFGMDVGSLA